MNTTGWKLEAVLHRLWLFNTSSFISLPLYVCDQPVHSSGSSGYGSLNRNDHLLGMTSSSDSLDKGSESKMRQTEEEVSSKARPVSEP